MSLTNEEIEAAIDAILQQAVTQTIQMEQQNCKKQLAHQTKQITKDVQAMYAQKLSFWRKAAFVQGVVIAGAIGTGVFMTR